MNLQGDVCYLIDGTGTAVASYTYDPYGNILSATGSMAEINPLRYRGYYYDQETGFYYLNERFYDPKIGRFLNADGYVSTGQGISGYNMFAYCLGNPVNMMDEEGNWPIFNLAKKISKAVITACKLIEDYRNYDKDNTDVKTVYKSNYFSSYKGTLVIRHSNEYLTSWAYGGTIVLNHNLDNKELEPKTDMLNHEYGHILQEQEYGTFDYTFRIFIPSATYNAFSQINKDLKPYYYSMPWEYDADVRGGVKRNYEVWADEVSWIYFGLLGE